MRNKLMKILLNHSVTITKQFEGDVNLILEEDFNDCIDDILEVITPKKQTTYTERNIKPQGKYNEKY